MKKLLIMIGTLSLLLCGCQSVDPEPSVRVGVIMPQTGEFAPYGIRVISGIEYFIQHYNAKHKVKLKLSIKDNQSTPTGTITAFRQLAEEGVPIVIGAYASSNTAVLKPFASRFKLPVITPTSTSDIVTENNPYMFRTCFSDSYQGEALGNFVKLRLKIKRLGILINIDEDGEYSKGLARSFSAAYKKAGGEVALKVGYSRQDANNFAVLVKQIINTEVEAIFAPTYLPEANKIIKAARKQGFSGQVFGGDGWDEAELLTSSGRNVNRCFFSTMFSATYNFPPVKSFVAGYKRSNDGDEPGLCAAQGYDTIAIIAGLIRNGELKNLEKQLTEVKNFPGVTGDITIKSDGNAVKTVFVERVNKLPNGSFVTELIGIIPPLTK
ncbi:MAG: ABC transporter substrate-binding protein [Victivallaceae bacterium]|nr:ABC transporter substrate-binding protein [Victivallaceae bacterium]